VLDLVIADLRMTPVSGLDVLRAVKQTTPDLEVILMTDYGTVETAVEAMRLGAFDFITKPLQHVEMLLRVRNALEKRRHARDSICPIRGRERLPPHGDHRHQRGDA